MLKLLSPTIVLLASMGLIATASAAHKTNKITIPSTPLVAGSHIPPNVLVGFDNSNSMESSIILKPSSLINNLLDCIKGRCFKPRRGGYHYKNVFPNHRYIYGNVKQVPHIQQDAAVRSPQYNLQYFDPENDYKPWPGYTKATGFNNLIENQNKHQAYYVPPKPDKHAQPPYTQQNTHINVANKIHLTQKYLAKNPASGNFTFYPATFYIKAKSKKAALKKAEQGKDFNQYRLKDVKPKTKVNGPHYSKKFAYYGRIRRTIKKVKKITLYKFQIKSKNFSSTKAYQTALTNFANWFTYHRTRAAAVKGAIVRAFNGAFHNSGRMKVGSCSLSNHPQHLKVKELSSKNAQGNSYYDSEFNHKIFTYKLPKRQNTPDAKTLNYLEKRFEKQKLITSPCQKNYVILFTDGYNNEKDPRTKYSDNDGVSKTMGDIAATYYHHLKPPTPSNWKSKHRNIPWPNNGPNSKGNGKVRTPAACQAKDHKPSLDCNPNLHVTTDAVTLGDQGITFGHGKQPYKSKQNLNNNKNQSLQKNVKGSTYHSTTNPGGIWPTKKVLQHHKKAQIDDLWHATVNSRGDMLNANQPHQLQNKFSKILRNVMNQQLSSSNLGLNQNTASSNTLVYSGSFQSWKGHLRAYPFNGGKIPALKGQPSSPGWQAVNGNINHPSKRKIVTRIFPKYLTKSKNPKNTNPKNTTLKNLETNASIRKNLKMSEKQIKYLRGHKANSFPQSTHFRNRHGDILGAIINSTPVYSGPRPEFTGYIGAFSNAPSYKDFVKDNSGRTPTLYVEANDGMLHAFNAGKSKNGGGNEEFAYIPAGVLPTIHGLTQKNPPRRFYADATPTVGDAVIKDRSTNNQKKWQTVLVAGERAGGGYCPNQNCGGNSQGSNNSKGQKQGQNSIFALNVTNPSQFTKNDVLWEDSNATKGISELGKTYSKPQIVRLNSGKWAAVFGNGYNSPDNDAVLYVVNLSSGNLIKKFVVSNKNQPSRSGPDGLSTPTTADINGDYKTDYVYAGDLHGNMWRFNLKSQSKSNWSASLLYTTSTNQNGNPRPITAAPIAGLGPPVPNGNRGIMVYFGTGQYLEQSDITAKNAQTKENYLYGIWDSTAGSGTPTPHFGVRVFQNQLADQHVISHSHTSKKTGRTYNGSTNKTVNYKHDTVNANKHYYRGWRLKFGADGERVITQPGFNQANNLIATTSIPSPKPCKAGGSGYFYRLDRYSGGPTTRPAFDVNGDGSFTVADKVFNSGSSSSSSIQSGAVRVAIHQGVITGSRSLSNSRIVTTSKYDQKVPENINRSRQITWRQIRHGG